MVVALVAIYFLLFFLLAWKNFRLAFVFFIILLPTYLIRFQVGPLPSTVLELSFGALFLVWLIKYSRYDYKNIWAVSQKHKLLFIAFDIFFLSSIVSIFVSDMWWFSLGEWRAYFLEPMILFLILVGRKNAVKISDLVWGLALSTVSISSYSVVQKFTGWGIATPEWTDEATRRVTAFFSSPNAVALYLAPIFILVIFLIINKKEKPKNLEFWGAVVIGVLSLLTIVFTKSQGAWVGLAAAVLAFLFFVGYKKIAIAMAVLGVIFALVVPPMRQAVLFQDQANQNRLRLWGYSWTFLGHSPKNFVLGTGVRQFFRKVQKPYYDKIVMERLIYPHNIFINFWTETGLLGMLAITTILGYTFYLANKIRKTNKLMGAALLGVLTVLVVHGLVDVPYFKNDLSFLFWIIIAFPFFYHENFYQSQTNVA
ncbi:MAG: Uncharacterized protein G01um101413_580 [Parcubacteria group bacterium Gr01-1014_13]|nr:MAG: Uncharacterized protein G01um101413_580 [Parcubacteria group bacterium Gr01-1014_13]